MLLPDMQSGLAGTQKVSIRKLQSKITANYSETEEFKKNRNSSFIPSASGKPTSVAYVSKNAQIDTIIMHK